MFSTSFKKIAMPLSTIKPASSKPARITPTMSPGNPVHGLRGLTGTPAGAPFGKPVNQFGTTARKGLVSRTSALRGIRI